MTLITEACVPTPINGVVFALKSVSDWFSALTAICGYDAFPGKTPRTLVGKAAGNVMLLSVDWPIVWLLFTDREKHWIINPFGSDVTTLSDPFPDIGK